MKIGYYIKLLREVNPWKTIYLNFHYFPFWIAIKTPIFIYWRTELKEMGGRIILPQTIWRGMLHFGKNQVGTIDTFYLRSIWELAGTLVIKGNANIGRGSKISVADGATLTMGKNLEITGNNQIICQKEISFGDNDLLSWEILIMDTDFHKIIPMDKNNEQVNLPSAIRIGPHVWVGCRSTILKGVLIARNCVISAGSIITRSIDEENCVIGGQGKSVSILKRNVKWKA